MIWNVHVPDPGFTGSKKHRTPDPDPQHCQHYTTLVKCAVPYLEIIVFALHTCFRFEYLKKCNAEQYETPKQS